MLEADGTTEEYEDSDSDVEEEMEEMEDDGQQPLRASTAKRLTVMKNRTMSVDSEASVYTQNSRLSSEDGHPQQPPVFSSTQASSKPAPLNLTQQPLLLLHTSWGSSAGVVCCGKWVHIPRFVKIVVDGVYTGSWCGFVDAAR